MSTGAIVAIVLAVALVPVVLIAAVTLLGTGAETSLTTAGESAAPTVPDTPSESEAIDLLTQELVTTASLPRADARCVSTVIVDDIGVEGLAKIGISTGGSGDIADLTPEEQDRLLGLITDAFATCDVGTN